MSLYRKIPVKYHSTTFSHSLLLSQPSLLLLTLYPYLHINIFTVEPQVIVISIFFSFSFCALRRRQRNGEGNFSHWETPPRSPSQSAWREICSTRERKRIMAAKSKRINLSETKWKTNIFYVFMSKSRLISPYSMEIILHFSGGPKHFLSIY